VEKICTMRLEIQTFSGGIGCDQDSKWILTTLYNQIDSDDADNDTKRVTGSLSHVPARNFRFIIEYTYDFEAEKSEGVLGVMVAF